MSKEHELKHAKAKQASPQRLCCRKSASRIFSCVLSIVIIATAVFPLSACSQVTPKPPATDNHTSGNTPGQNSEYVIISNLTVFDIKDTSITASWTTNVPATAVLQAYQPLRDETLSSTPDNTLALEHTVIINGLAPSSPYRLTVVSADASGREVKVAIDRQYTTPAAGSTAPVAVGDHSPDFSLTSTTGELVTSASFAGKRILLVLWKLTCDSCRGELPHINQFYSTLADNDLELITISVLDKAELITSYAEGKGYTFPILIDPEGEVSKIFNADKFPVNILIDASGNVAKIQRGPFESVPEISEFMNSP